MATAANTIRASTITTLLRTYFDPTGRRRIPWDAKLATVVVGAGGVLSALAGSINTSDQFKSYALGLTGNDLATAVYVYDLISAISAKFRANGWRVDL